MELEKAYFIQNLANERLFVESTMSLVLYFQNRSLSFLKISIVRSAKLALNLRKRCILCLKLMF